MTLKLSLAMLAAVACAAVTQTGRISPTPGYSPQSPHWPHVRTFATDYRTQYLQDQKQAQSERAWLAQHADYILGAQADKRVNPRVQSYVYALNLNVFEKDEAGLGTGYYGDMRKWFKAHPEFTLETAFLHDDKLCPAPQPVTAGCRLEVFRWADKRWVINPADAGVAAYEKDRLARLAADRDGVFFDEHESYSPVAGWCGKDMHTREYRGLPDACAVYFDAVVRLLETEHNALAPKRLLVNITEYMTEYDLRMAVAAGGAQLELANNPARETEPKWQFIDQLLARGVFVVYTPPDPDWYPKNYTKGNSETLAGRWDLALLANYYMVVPDPPDHLAFENRRDWKHPYSIFWTKAQEIDLGPPLGRRRVYLTGTDRAGQNYRVYIREFQNAYVLSRPMIKWSDSHFGEETAVEVATPGNRRLVPLSADGSRGAASSSVSLRHVEAAILLKM